MYINNFFLNISEILSEVCGEHSACYLILPVFSGFYRTSCPIFEGETLGRVLMSDGFSCSLFWSQFYESQDPNIK